MKLTDEYHISEKTLRNDIQEMMEFTRESGLKSALFCDSQKLSLNGSQKIRELMDHVYSMDLYQYKMSPEERKIYITIVLLYHKGYYSMQQLADELYVTRNTIVNDCKLVDEYMAEYKIIFVAKSKLGIKMETKEENTQKLLIGMFRNLIPDIKSEKTFFVRFIIKKMGFIYSFKDVIFHVNQGVALAHVRKESGVYEDGISLLVSKEGITFDEGDTVHLLFFFSQKGETDYLDLFKEIIKLGKNQNDIDKIRTLSDSRDVYRTLWTILAED